MISALITCSDLIMSSCACYHIATVSRCGKSLCSKGLLRRCQTMFRCEHWRMIGHGSTQSRRLIYSKCQIDQTMPLSIWGREGRWMAISSPFRFSMLWHVSSWFQFLLMPTDVCTDQKTTSRSDWMLSKEKVTCNNLHHTMVTILYQDNATECWTTAFREVERCEAWRVG